MRGLLKLISGGKDAPPPPRGWRCDCCGEIHDGLPALGYRWPDYFTTFPPEEQVRDFVVDANTCAYKDEHFFVRAVLRLPILGTDGTLEFGPWSTVSQANYARYTAVRTDADAQALEPMFGWFANALPDYPDTSQLKGLLHVEDADHRPWLELEPSDHPLSVHQREGVTLDYAVRYAHAHMGLD